MEPFTQHTGIVATLNLANVDTDQIIPKQFLKSIKRTGFGPSAFFDWRYGPDAEPNPDFELNQPRFDGRSILITRNNFGCGSSREHAVWALVQDGYKVIVAPRKAIGGDVIPGFADIFKNNTTKNGMLAIELEDEEVEEIFQLVGANEGMTATADLAAQTLTFEGGPEPKVYSFEIDDGVKQQLINGFDDIDLTLQFADHIDSFETKHDTQINQG